MEQSEAESLKSLLIEQPVAALATLHKNEPAISMVPFALLAPDAGFVVHVSRLAAHTADMLAHPAVALLVNASANESRNPLALTRVSVQGTARQLMRDSDEHERARIAYVTKLPESEGLFSFPDFSIFVIDPETIRFVAGFARAMSLSPGRLRAILAAD